MKSDIAGRGDIEILIDSFYQKVTANQFIGHMFHHVDWRVHMPTMYNFWEQTIFHTGSYSGNTLKVHQDLHKRMPLSIEHFDVWLSLFIANADELFEGPNTELAKQRAASIATVIKLKTVFAGENEIGIARKL